MDTVILDSSIFSSSDEGSLTRKPSPSKISTTPVTISPPPSTVLPVPTPVSLLVTGTSTICSGHRQTHSMSFKRRQAVTAMHVIAQRDHEIANSKCKRHRSKTSKCPKRMKIDKSRIPNVGLGLYLLENVKKVTLLQDTVVSPSTKLQMRRVQYTIALKSAVTYLNVDSDYHFEDRYINVQDLT